MKNFQAIDMEVWVSNPGSGSNFSLEMLNFNFTRQKLYVCFYLPIWFKIHIVWKFSNERFAFNYWFEADVYKWSELAQCGWFQWPSNLPEELSIPVWLIRFLWAAINSCCLSRQRQLTTYSVSTNFNSKTTL